MEEFIWYYADSQALQERTPIGPVSIRDLDVLYRTSAINSSTYVWKEGMPEWVQLFKVQELKEAILDEQQDIKVIQELYEKQQQELALGNQKGKKQQKIQDKLDKKQAQIDQKLLEEAKYNQQMNSGKEEEISQDKVQQNIELLQQIDEEDVLDEDEEEEREYLKLLQENPEEAIQRMANNTLNSYFYYSEDDKKWNICREDENNERVWIQQDEEPKEEMDKMRNELIDKLRKQFISEENKDVEKLKSNLKDQLQIQNDIEENNADPKDKEMMKGMTAEQIKKIKRNKKKAKRQAEKKKQKWYQSRVNTYIYVKGLPHSITEEKLDEFFSRAGVIRKDPITDKKKIKIYQDEQGLPKGDAVISFQMMESVEIAITMLDEREIEPGHVIRVERANFEQHGETYKKREGVIINKEKGLDKIQLAQMKAAQRQALGWEDEDQIDTGLKIVILKNVFTLKDIEEDENFLEELREEMAKEIESSCGPIQRLKIFEENPEGVIEIKFKNSTDAKTCIDKMNGRYFDERELECFFWDGKTDYKRTSKQIEDDEKRLEEFGKWIEGGDNNSENGQKQIS
ncbi:hypothetical protein ABPG74_021222 [Tetrahymena malaccensis]